MNEKDMRCRKCGRRIGIVTCGIYRRIVIDPECLMIVPDPEGEDFVRVDGSKIKGKERNGLLGDEPAEPAYRMHRKTCGGNR